MHSGQGLGSDGHATTVAHDGGNVDGTRAIIAQRARFTQLLARIAAIYIRIQMQMQMHIQIS